MRFIQEVPFILVRYAIYRVLLRSEKIMSVETLAPLRLWGGVGWQFVTDVSEKHTSPIFKGKSVQEDLCVDWPLKVWLVCCSETSVITLLDCLTLEGWTVKLSRNVGNQVLNCAT
jgi:hypothetical protein